MNPEIWRYTEIVNAVEIQFVSNEAGEPTAVIVPIDLWREIESERETAYLLKSEPMRQRLLAAKQREDGLPFEAVLENFAFDGPLQAYPAWQQDHSQDLRMLRDEC